MKWLPPSEPPFQISEWLSEKSRQAGTYLREVRENGMGMIGHGVISKPFMGLRILVPFAGPLRNAAAACSGTKQTRSAFRMAEGKTVPAYFQTASEWRRSAINTAIGMPGCRIRGVAALSPGIVARANGWVFSGRLLHSRFHADLSRRFHWHPETPEMNSEDLFTPPPPAGRGQSTNAPQRKPPCPASSSHRFCAWPRIVPGTAQTSHPQTPCCPPPPHP